MVARAYKFHRGLKPMYTLLMASEKWIVVKEIHDAALRMETKVTDARRHIDYRVRPDADDRPGRDNTNNIISSPQSQHHLYLLHSQRVCIFGAIGVVSVRTSSTSAAHGYCRFLFHILPILLSCEGMSPAVEGRLVVCD